MSLETFAPDTAHRSPDSVYWAIANGRIEGASYHVLSSYKKGISTSVLDDISLIPGTTVVPYPNGQQLRVVSDSAQDNPSGTGIRQIRIHYLDSDYTEQTETLAMSGLTPVNTGATNIYRILGFHSTNSNWSVAAGNISLTNIAGTVTYDYIESGGNQRLTCHFTIPNGKIGLITGWQATSVKQAMSVRLRATRDPDTGELLSGTFIFHDVVNLSNSSSGQIRFTCPIKCEARTDVKISALAGTANGDCSASFAVVVMNA